MNQLNMFELMYDKYKIDKPIRLIELFGGIGSQAKALENLHCDFTHYKLVEYDKYPVASYNAIHGTDFKPMDITKIHANDLEIVDRDKYTYICTYSFPCTDLSLAGKGAGMKKGSGTRSGLLWEVERLLNECGDNLPQVLLMENVPQVIGEKNKADFDEWCRFLGSKGYSNYYQLLNAKDYGIPQNRNRCFMVSILGEYYYEFPKPIELKLKLKDMLETNVDEKYYLSQKMIKYIVADNEKWTGNNNESLVNKNVASTLNTKEGGRRCDSSNYVCDELPENTDLKLVIKNATKKGFLMAEEGDAVDISGRMQYHRGTVQKGISQTITTAGGDNVGVVVKDDLTIIDDTYKNRNARKYADYAPTLRSSRYGLKVGNVTNLRIRKLTPRECWRLMGFSDIDYDRASKVNSANHLYKQAGNSIVVNVLMAIFKEML